LANEQLQLGVSARGLNALAGADGDELDRCIGRLLAVTEARAVNAAIQSPPALDKNLRAIVELLRDHRGADRPITIEGIRVHVPLSERQVKKSVKQLVEVYGLPVGASRHFPAGYFLVVTAADREAALRPLRAEFYSLLRRIKALGDNRVVEKMLGEAQQELRFH
jgi:hypothetical protein